MGQYFEARPAVASDRREIKLTLPDLTLDLASDRGVFAADRVDSGTRVLLQEMPLPPNDGRPLLDVGCGIGVIAVTLAVRSPAAQVWAVDVNERALGLTKENAARAGVGVRVQAVEPDAIPDDVRFAAIYSNPPIRIGKKALHELLVRWLDRLEPDGGAYLVVQKHLGADSLAAWLAGEGYPTSRLTSRAGYRVLEVRPR